MGNVGQVAERDRNRGRVTVERTAIGNAIMKFIEHVKRDGRWPS
jgi:hypothetical protein